MVKNHVKFRLPLSLLFAGILSFFFYDKCFLDLNKIRIPIASDPIASPSEGILVLPFQTVPEDRVSLCVLSLALRNSGAEAQQFDVSLNSNRIATLEIHAGSSLKQLLEIDGNGLLKFQNRLKLSTGTNDWSVEKAEIRNMLAYSSGLLSFCIVAPHFSDYHSPSMVPTLLVFIVLFALGLAGDLRKVVPWILKSVVILGACAILVYPHLAPHVLLVASQTFFLLCAFAYAPELASAGAAARSFMVREHSRMWTALKEATVIALVFLFFFVSIQFYRERHINDSGFLYLTGKFVNENPFLRQRKDILQNLEISADGYDGQFMYNLAFDPFISAFKDRPKLYTKIADDPPYRYFRIGFPLLIKLFSGDRPELYPTTMIYLILCSHLLGVFFLMKIFQHYGKDPLWGLAYLLVPGFLVSMKFALPESISAAFLLGGFWLFLKEKHVPAAILLAVSMMIRETAIPLILCLVLFEFWKKKSYRNAAILACSVLPYFVWRFFVTVRMWPHFGTRALYTPGNATLPFAAFPRLWTAYVHGQYSSGSAGIVFAAILIALFLLALGLFLWRKNAVSAAFLLYCILMVSFTYGKMWIALNNVERISSEMFLFFLISFASLRNEHRKLQLVFLFMFAVLFWYACYYSSVSDCFQAIVPLRALG